MARVAEPGDDLIRSVIRSFHDHVRLNWCTRRIHELDPFSGTTQILAPRVQDLACELSPRYAVVLGKRRRLFA
jgi:hypothetical protein